MGSDGSRPVERIERNGSWAEEVSESMVFGVFNVSPGLSNRGEEAIMELFIDDGVVGRRHRDNIWSSTYRKTGIAHCKTANRETLVVITYAGNFVLAPAM
jgi:uncharacterized protein YkwD